jgi:hypothetical protein
VAWHDPEVEVSVTAMGDDPLALWVSVPQFAVSERVVAPDQVTETVVGPLPLKGTTAEVSSGGSRYP